MLDRFGIDALLAAAGRQSPQRKRRAWTEVAPDMFAEHNGKKIGVAFIGDPDKRRARDLTAHSGLASVAPPDCWRPGHRGPIT